MSARQRRREVEPLMPDTGLGLPAVDSDDDMADWLMNPDQPQTSPQASSWSNAQQSSSANAAKTRNATSSMELSGMAGVASATGRSIGAAQLAPTSSAGGAAPVRLMSGQQGATNSSAVTAGAASQSQQHMPFLRQPNSARPVMSAPVSSQPQRLTAWASTAQRPSNASLQNRQALNSAAARQQSAEWAKANHEIQGLKSEVARLRAFVSLFAAVAIMGLIVAVVGIVLSDLT